MTRVLCVQYECEMPSLANVRWHWRKHMTVAKKQRTNAYFHCLSGGSRPKRFPCVVELVRFGRRLDDDNLQRSLKHVRDGVADFLGMDDRDKRIMWKYDQQNGTPGCRVTIWEAE